jgi:hypothetical protein
MDTSFDLYNRQLILAACGRWSTQTRRWREWYSQAVPLADRLFDEHLRRLVEERLIDDD